MAWGAQVWRGVADDASIHNPLERLNRLGCGWMGAVFEWEGVLVGDFPNEHRDAWLALAEEEGKPPPLAFALKRADGMKSEQVPPPPPPSRYMPRRPLALPPSSFCPLLCTACPLRCPAPWATLRCRKRRSADVRRCVRCCITTASLCA